MQIKYAVVLGFCLTCFPDFVLAAEVVRPASQTRKGFEMDYGPFLSYSVLKPQSAVVPGVKVSAEKKQPGDPTPPWKAGDLLATKGLSVKLGEDAGICFDIDTCRYAAGWTGGFLDISQSNLVRNQGPMPAIVKGTLVFTTVDAPGWTKGNSFKDPRRLNSDPRLKTGEGPLPRDWAHYRGLYRDGSKVVFEYTVGETQILDMPGVRVEAGRVVLTRTLRLEPHAESLAMQVCAMEAAGVTGGAGEGKGRSAAIFHEDQAMCVSIVGEASGATLRHGGAAGEASRIDLSIAPSAKPAQIQLVLASGSSQKVDALLQSLESIKAEAEDLTTHTKGGPALWRELLQTQGNIAPDTTAYVIDTIALPEINPWKSWMKPSGLDFTPDGRAAVCTLSGDVWIAYNLDAKLDRVQWKRFATGLYEPLGLKIVDGNIYVLDRSGIVKLHDLNHDGEADFYENFNSDMVSDANYHSFHMDLQTDREGNFYYAVTGNQMPLAKPDHSCIVKVSKYGDKAEILCTGLRAANGLGMGPNDELTVGDNQGHWVPASPIFLARPGAFFGFHGDSRRVSNAEFATHLSEHPKNDLPICWVPYSWDNSAGGQVWAGKNWGPFSGHMLHMSYGKCALFAVLTEQVDGVMQGGVVRIPGKFDSGVMRGRINPVDGQVWLCGLNGWQSNAGKDGCLQRVRYTGKPSVLPTDLHMTTKGVRVTFPLDLDPATAVDEGGYTFEVWGYHVSEKYGSDEFKISVPTVKGHDSLDVKKVTLLADKRSVLIDVRRLGPVTNYILKMRLDAVDGTAIKCDIGGSIQKLGNE